MRVSLCLLIAILGSCTPSKPRAESRPEGSPLPTAGSAPSAGTAGTPSLAEDDNWEGTYLSEAGSFYVVDSGEWAGVKWRGDDASTGLGEGKISLRVQGEPRRVTGTGSGVIGDVVLVGALDGDTLTASVLRKDPLDGGLTGTAVGKVSRDQIVGTMRLSLANARVVRAARFTLARRKL